LDNQFSNNSLWSIKQLTTIERLNLNAIYSSILLDGTLIYDKTLKTVYQYDKINNNWFTITDIRINVDNKIEVYNRSTGVWDLKDIDVQDLYVYEKITITDINTCNNLGYIPYDDNNVILICNSLILNKGYDYSISGQVITLTPVGFTITTDDILYAQYYQEL
jgi:hypothetical protein